MKNLERLKMFIIKNKYYFISLILLIAIESYNINYAINGYINNQSSLNSFFGMYFNLSRESSGTVFIILRIILIIFGSTYIFYKELSSGFYKNIVNKMKYSKYIRKNILLCYFRSLMLKPLTSILILLFISMKFPFNILDFVINTSNYYNSAMSDYFLVLAIQISVSFLITSIALVLIYVYNKFYMSVFVTYIFYTIYDVLILDILIKIIYKLDVHNIFNHQYIMSTLIGIYNREPMLNDYAVLISVIVGVLVSFGIIHMVYKNKERLVLRSE